jgi:hypothetical protein
MKLNGDLIFVTIEISKLKGEGKPNGFFQIPPTAERVQLNISSQVNERIMEKTK